ncbi:MAG: hypothetical protein WBA05_09035, partial [Gordonia sp. (in: high G+C Gram-positive bacteria)]
MRQAEQFDVASTTVYDLDGHRDSVRRHPVAPEILTVAAFKRLTSEEQTQWCADRDLHHCRSHTV